MIPTEVLAASKGYFVFHGQAYGPRGRLKAAPDSKGYLRFNVALGSRGRFKTCWVHRLVAFQKYGMAIYQVKDVRHLDGDHRNNADSNIATGTRLQNLMDMSPAQRREKSLKMNRTRHGEMWGQIEAELAKGQSPQQTAQTVGCHKRTVQLLIKRKKITKCG